MARLANRWWEKTRGVLKRAKPAEDDWDHEELTVDDLARALPNLLGHHERRVWCYDGRAHVELRELSPDDVLPLRDAIGRQLVDGRVALHDLNTVAGRAIFAFAGNNLSSHYFAAIVSRAEHECGLDDRPFPLDRPKYPADAEPIARLLLELAADSTAASLGATLKAIGFEPTRTEFDLAAFVAWIQSTPRIRDWLKRRLGAARLEVGLGTSGAFLQAVGSGPTGPALDILLQALKLRGELARRWTWLELEPELTRTPRIDETTAFLRPERPAPMPEGEIERYAQDALYVSLGGFAVGLLDTESLEASFAPLFSGLPKAARYGCEAFVAELNRTLGDRGAMVMRPPSLHLLDRITAVVLDGRVMFDEGEIDLQAENLAVAIRAAQLDLVVVHPDERLSDVLDPVEWIAPEPDAFDDVLTACVNRLQRENHVVAVVSAAAHRALLAADFGIGVRREAVPPWEADVIVSADIDDTTFLIEACGESRELSHQSITLASVGAALGALTNVGRGIETKSPLRVMSAVNAASLLALANGVRRAQLLERRPRPVVPDATMWHEMSATEAIEQVGATLQGLTEEQARERTVSPDVADGRVRQLAHAFGRELANPFTPILAGGAALAAIVGSTADAAIVGAAVALSAGIGGVERYVSERGIAELENTERVPVTVVRNGIESDVEPSNIVVGDIVLLKAADVVPADCRIIEAHGLEADQSSLTGESLTVPKSADTSDASELSERSSMLFEGTVVTNGTARAVVVAVGPGTQAARAARLAHSPPESGVERRLHDIAELTLPVAGLSGLMLASVGLAQGRDLRSIVGTGVGLAVASVPEGLPLLSTMAQLAAAHRLARRGIIVRTPRTIEALGRVDVICVDKTGTLTEGKIRLHGAGDGTGPMESVVTSPGARRVLAAALRATPNGGTNLRHATDRAIVEGAASADISPEEGSPGWTPLAHLPFGHDRAFHAVLGNDENGTFVFVKGAPETVLPRCVEKLSKGKARRLTSVGRRRLGKACEDFAGQGRRVLCVAMRPLTGTTLQEESVQDLVFVGFVTLTDPIRGTAAPAVHALREAGIRALMITGDHPQTAHRIGIEVGMVEPDQTAEEVVLTGSDVERLTDPELADALWNARVVARATPLHKVRIVRALQRAGHTVAMTGDGGNDASAIRLANVGIALGRQSSRAARHAADMIVVDPRLETIVEGIAEGRAMWPAVRDAVALLIGGNLGEIGFTVAAGVMGTKSGLTARQLLLVNLLTDIAPAMAIALQPPSSDDLRASLAQAVDTTVGRALEEQISTRAASIGGAAAVAWSLARAIGSEEKASTVALLTLVGSQVGQTLVSGHRSRDTIIASLGTAALLLGIVETPGVSHTFGCRPVGPIGLGIAGAASITSTYVARFGREHARQLAERIQALRSRKTHEVEPRDLLAWPFADLESEIWFGER